RARAQATVRVFGQGNESTAILLTHGVERPRRGRSTVPCPADRTLLRVEDTKEGPRPPRIGGHPLRRAIRTPPRPAHSSPPPRPPQPAPAPPRRHAATLPRSGEIAPSPPSPGGRAPRNKVPVVASSKTHPRSSPPSPHACPPPPPPPPRASLTRPATMLASI